MNVLIFLSLLCASNLSFAVDLFKDLHYKCKETWRSQLIEIQNTMNHEEKALADAGFEIDSFSFCVNPDHDNHPFLEDFKYVFRELKAKTPTKPLMAAGFTRNFRFVVPDASVHTLRQRIQGFFVWDDKAVYEGVIITVIQSPLGLPFGQIYPPSESLLCKNTDTWYKQFNLEHDVRAIPCLYRPKYSIMHPNILVIKKNKNIPLQNALSFDFKYADLPCNEANGLQYQAMLVSDFGSDTRKPKYNISISVVFPRFADDAKKDSIDGVPQEIYWGWRPKKIGAGQDSGLVACYPDHSNVFSETCVWNDCLESACACDQFKNNNPILETTPPFVYKSGHVAELLKQNTEYNHCVWDKKGLNIETGECPPGPFACAKNDAKSKEDFKKLFPYLRTNGQAEFKLTYSELTHCKNWTEDFSLQSECDVKEFHQDLIVQCEYETNRTGWNLVKEEDANFTDAQRTKAKDKEIEEYRIFCSRNRKFHGAMSIFALFVVNFFANFLARFFKETPRSNGKIGFCGGCWLLGHLTLIFASLYLIVGGAVFVGKTPTNCYYFEKGTTARSECDSDSDLLHRTIGCFVLIFFLLNIPLGMIRPLKPKYRTILIWVHAVLGYFVQILAVTNVMLSHGCLEIKLLTCAIIIVNITLIGAATFVQMRLDKNNDILRTIVPVPETLHRMHSVKCLKRQIAIILVAIIIPLVVIVLISVLYYKQQSKYITQIRKHSIISVCTI